MMPRLKVSLRACNTLRLEAQAAAYATVQNDHELLQALDWARQRGLPVVPLGEGSNVVLAGDLDALVLHQQTSGREVLQRSSKSVRLRVAAGESWHGLVSWCLASGYHGLENLAWIPGTVGAAPVQNIGAYGVELASMLCMVHARRLTDGSPLQLDNADCELGYRDSVFKRGLRDEVVITAVELELSLSPGVNIDYPSLAQYLRTNRLHRPTPQDVYDAVVDIRKSRLPDPHVEPNAGSFFKNPVLSAREFDALQRAAPGVPGFSLADGQLKVPAAWLIDHCGWKGVRRKEQGVHAEHALVLVNYGNDSGADLLGLAATVRDSVLQTFGVTLEVEPRQYGGDA